MGQIQLVILTKDNWYECTKLNVAEHQQPYMEPNEISMAQMYFEPSLKAYGIALDGKMIGFVMFNQQKEELDGYWIYRIMIDEVYQRKGFAKKALQLVIEEIRELPSATKIIAGVHPENYESQALFRSVNFIDEGHCFGKEIAIIKSI